MPTSGTPKQPCIMVIGAHAADAELMGGAVALMRRRPFHERRTTVESLGIHET